MAKTPYDKYLKRLQTSKTQTGLGEYARGIQSLTTTTKALSDKMSGMRMGNVSASARAATLQQALATTQGTQAQMTAQYMQNEEQRAAQINQEIGKVETQREGYLEAKRKEENAKKRSMIGTVAQVGGAILGGIAGGLIAGPAGILAGASMGSSLGGAVGGVADAGVPADYNAVVQGVGDTIMSYASYANTAKTQQTMKAVSNNIGKLSNLTPAQLNIASSTLPNMIASGADESAILDFINNLTNQQQQQMPIDNNIDLSTYYNPVQGGI